MAATVKLTAHAQILHFSAKRVKKNLKNSLACSSRHFKIIVLSPNFRTATQRVLSIMKGFSSTANSVFFLDNLRALAISPFHARFPLRLVLLFYLYNLRHHHVFFCERSFDLRREL